MSSLVRHDAAGMPTTYTRRFLIREMKQNLFAVDTINDVATVRPNGGKHHAFALRDLENAITRIRHHLRVITIGIAGHAD